MFKTIEDFVGNTPLVRLKRLSGKTSNVILAKLEGNNPAGSVKDRPALSMVLNAQKRGRMVFHQFRRIDLSENSLFTVTPANAVLGDSVALPPPCCRYFCNQPNKVAYSMP